MAAITMLPPPGGSVNQVCVSSVDAELRRRVIDFAEMSTAKGSTVAAGDTSNIITFNAGDFVTNVWVRQLVAGTSGSTVTLGDTAVSATAWTTSVATDAAAQTFTVQDGANASAGKLYASADALKLTIGTTAPTSGKIEVTARVVPFGTSIVE